MTRTSDPRDNMTLDAWADLLAHVERFPEERRDEVLLRLGHEQGAWERISREGNDLLRRAIRAGDIAAVQGFGRALYTTKQRLEAEGKTVEDLGPLPAAGPDADAAPPTLAEPPLAISAAPPDRDRPTPPPAPRAHPVLTLSQYACLRAETVNAPDETTLARVRASYGLDPASDEAEARAWTARFSDRRTFQEYKTLFDYYRATLGRRPA